MCRAQGEEDARCVGLVAEYSSSLREGRRVQLASGVDEVQLARQRSRCRPVAADKSSFDVFLLAVSASCELL